MIVAKYAAYCKAYHLPSGGLRGAGSSIFSEQVLPLRSVIDYLLTVMEHPRSARFQTTLGSRLVTTPDWMQRSEALVAERISATSQLAPVRGRCTHRCWTGAVQTSENATPT